MRKGQFFTIDMFIAFGIFLVVLISIMFVGAELSVSQTRLEIVEEVQSYITQSMDWIVYSENTSYSPYHLKTAETQALFAKTPEEIKEQFHFGGWKHQMKIQEFDGNILLFNGDDLERKDVMVNQRRLVYYNSKKCILSLVVWIE